MYNSEGQFLEYVKPRNVYDTNLLLKHGKKSPSKIAFSRQLDSMESYNYSASNGAHIPLNKSPKHLDEVYYERSSNKLTDFASLKRNARSLDKKGGDQTTNGRPEGARLSPQRTVDGSPKRLFGEPDRNSPSNKDKYATNYSPNKIYDNHKLYIEAPPHETPSPRKPEHYAERANRHDRKSPALFSDYANGHYKEQSMYHRGQTKHQFNDSLSKNISIKSQNESKNSQVTKSPNQSVGGVVPKTYPVLVDTKITSIHQDKASNRNKPNYANANARVETKLDITKSMNFAKHNENIGPSKQYIDKYINEDSSNKFSAVNDVNILRGKLQQIKNSGTQHRDIETFIKKSVGQRRHSETYDQGKNYSTDQLGYVTQKFNNYDAFSKITDDFSNQVISKTTDDNLERYIKEQLLQSSKYHLGIGDEASSRRRVRARSESESRNLLDTKANLKDSIYQDQFNQTKRPRDTSPKKTEEPLLKPNSLIKAKMPIATVGSAGNSPKDSRYGKNMNMVPITMRNKADAIIQQSKDVFDAFTSREETKKSHSRPQPDNMRGGGSSGHLDGAASGDGVRDFDDDLDYSGTDSAKSICVLQDTLTPHTDHSIPFDGCPFAASLFPNVAPSISFADHDNRFSTMPTKVYKVLKWKLTNITPIVVRKTLVNTGFRLLRNTEDWTGQWGKHMKSPYFRTLRNHQKLNHFPGTFQIGRKDRLWRNLQKCILKHGKKEFGFIPTTYCLPQDIRLLRQQWEKYSQREEKWIVKPPASARGTGIKVITRWQDIPKRKPCVVQKYISRPLLINGSKFDLRLYVLVTSMHPLRVYLYPDGLARFASVKYTDDMEHLTDRYMHLTNYSINKLSTTYATNEDAEACEGHKWTIKSLWTYLHARGINTKLLWRAISDLVVRTMISGESSIHVLSRLNAASRYNCYELFGIDVLLDEELKPWLLEVNISPSLHSGSPLDLHVKGPLVSSLLNTALYKVPHRLNDLEQSEIMKMYNLEGPLCLDKRMYCVNLSEQEKEKHLSFSTVETRGAYLESILETLTPDDVRHLVQAEDELNRCKPLERIFPTAKTYHYHNFFEAPRYYNRLFDAWEHKYSKNRQAGLMVLRILCEQKVHLEVPPPQPAWKGSDTQVVTSNLENGRPITLGAHESAYPGPPNTPAPVSLGTNPLYTAHAGPSGYQQSNAVPQTSNVTGNVTHIHPKTSINISTALNNAINAAYNAMCKTDGKVAA